MMSEQRMAVRDALYGAELWLRHHEPNNAAATMRADVCAAALVIIESEAIDVLHGVSGVSGMPLSADLASPVG